MQYIFTDTGAQILIASGIVCLILYIFDSIALSTITENRRLSHAWFAWLPVLRLWLIGSVSDHYRQIARADTKKRQGILTVLGALQAVVLAAFIVLSYLSLYAESISMSLSCTVAMIACFYVFCVLSVVVAIYYLLCLYIVFLSCKPTKAVAFLIVSIILPVIKPFLLFACRKKNDGMPDGFRLKGAEEHWKPTDED